MRFLLLLLLIGCSDTEVEKVSFSLEKTNQKSTWYELPQYFDDIPKYSGAFGTYTAKHTPIAIQHDGKTYYTYSDNSDGSLKIYMSDGLNTVKLHTTVLNDPHSNASISIDKDGYIWAHVSAKGSAEPGATYKSKEPESLEFELIEETWQAYPQPWKTDFGQVILHTIYEIPVSKKVRQLYTKTDECNKLLVEGGHYQVSTYRNGKIHTFYNWHPDARVDDRTNIYYMWSYDGCTWFNEKNEALDLPLEEDSALTKIYSTDRNIYLKDIDVEEEPLLMYVESDTHKPNEGSRELYLLRLGQTPEYVAEINHNYSTGFYQDGYIVTPLDGQFGYAGGNLSVLKKTDGLWEQVHYETGHYNYLRKIYNGQGGIGSNGDSSINNGAEIIRLNLL